jgi:hypothetical protein
MKGFIIFDGRRVAGYYSEFEFVPLTGFCRDGRPFKLTNVVKHPQQPGFVMLYWSTHGFKPKKETEVISELDLVFEEEPPEPPKPIVCRRVPSKLGGRIEKRKKLGLHACKSEGFLEIEKLLKCEEVLDDSRHY